MMGHLTLTCWHSGDYMTDENKVFQTPDTDHHGYSLRYFVSTDAENYVNGMLIAFTDADAESYIAQKLTELSQAEFEATGPASRLINGVIVEGEPRIPVLNTEAKLAILAARLRDASIQIQTLQDAVDLDIATDEEKSSLVEWKRYRVLLSRVDPETQPPEEWPQQPKT